MLHHAQTLEINGNPGALRDLLAYVEGRYELGERWKRRELSENMEVIVEPTNESAPLIRQLREHFENLIVSLDLGVENVVSADCHYYIFTNCREARPRSLTVNAPLGASGCQLYFSHTDGEVHIPNITIGSQGDLGAIVRNEWWNGESGADNEGGCYSLLHHASKLEIKDNPNAVKSLVSYVNGTYQLGKHW